MFFKMAINNVKKSFRDYTIYFLTLTFAVCIFYSFNSIHAQASVLEVGQSSVTYMKTLIRLIAGASIFISFILGGLIIYANNFLIKNRKKELGIYMTLGMGKNKISQILVYETFIIGILSLGLGLILGIIVSQGLSVVTAKLFALNMSSFKFIISLTAIGKTVLYFGIAFIVVMLFNKVNISKYKLIDLLNASKKNENIKVKNPAVSLCIFLFSLAILGFAYVMVIKLGLYPTEPKFILYVIMGILGTILFFFSLSGFFIQTVQKNNKIYLKKLNIFILRQVNNKINTNFMSMAVICLMLFVTILCLFTMVSYKGNLDNSIKGNTSFDASAKIYIFEDDLKGKDIKDELDKLNFKFNSSDKHIFYNMYYINVTLKDLLDKYADEKDKKDIEAGSAGGNITIIKASDYNELLQLQNQEKITLKNNEVLVATNYGESSESISRFMKNEKTININGNSYMIRNKDVINQNIENRAFDLTFFYLVVADDFNGEMTLFSTNMNVKFEENNIKKSEEKFSTLFEDFRLAKYDTDKFGFIQGYTKQQATAVLYGSSAVIVFLGLYVGIVILISSAAVLAIQQLSDASDSLDRYKSLKKIGATSNMINKTIFLQTLISFMLPFALAIIHSIAGIILTNDAFQTHNKSVIGSSSLMISLIIAIIYGGYFYATYEGYKNIVKNS